MCQHTYASAKPGATEVALELGADDSDVATDKFHHRILVEDICSLYLGRTTFRLFHRVAHAYEQDWDTEPDLKIACR
jgi:hypothetical protein